jgi:small subunit ribosomal protein S8
MEAKTKVRRDAARENISDPIGDMLTRVRNGLMRRHGRVRAQASKKKRRILDVLVDEGYLRGVTEVTGPTGLPEFEIALKYHDGKPVIRELKRVSKPGRRAYFGSTDIPMVRNGLGVAVVSTNRGVMSDAKARELNVGGELVCTVF